MCGLDTGRRNDRGPYPHAIGFLVLLLAMSAISGNIFAETAGKEAGPAAATSAQAETDQSGEQADQATGEEDSRTARRPVATGEVVVTARKRTESLEDVPVSVTAISNLEIQNQNMTTVRDVAELVPNVAFLGSANNTLTNFSVRGVQATSQVRLAGFDSGVAVYVDGVVRSRPTDFNQELNDVERVEFLRGPQGTLFGRNSIGGAISVVTRKPSFVWAGDFSVRYGDYDETYLNAYVSGPLGGKAAMSVAGFKATRDGFLTNLYDGAKLDDEDAYGGRFKLLLEPSDRLEIQLVADAIKEDQLAPVAQILTDPMAVPGIRNVNVDQPTVAKRDGLGLQLNVDYDLPQIDATLTSITAYREMDTTRFNDSDLTPMPIVVTNISPNEEQWSQELRLTSTGDRSVNYVLGVYFFNLNNADNITASVFNAYFPTVFGEIETTDYAAFAHMDWRFASDWVFTGGLRYQYEDKELRYEQQGFPIAPDLPYEVDSLDYSVLLPTVGVRWETSDNSMVYFDVRRGFKGGGWNNDSIQYGGVDNFSDLRFGEETAWSYELGLKSSCSDGRLIANLAAFYLDYQDLQTRVRVPVEIIGQPVVQSVFRNAASAETYGFEVELAAKPVDGLSLNASVGYVKAQFVSYQPDEDTDLSGVSLPGAPEWTGNLYGTYQLPISGGLDLRFTAGVSHRGDYVAVADSPGFEVDAVTLANATVALMGTRSGWELAVWARNLMDEEYFVQKTPPEVGFAGPQGELGVWGPPRQFGVTAAYRF